jgi:hypothetical protein
VRGRFLDVDEFVSTRHEEGQPLELLAANPLLPRGGEHASNQRPLALKLPESETPYWYSTA